MFYYEGRGQARANLSQQTCSRRDTPMLSQIASVVTPESDIRSTLELADFAMRLATQSKMPANSAKRTSWSVDPDQLSGCKRTCRADRWRCRPKTASGLRVVRTAAHATACQPRAPSPPCCPSHRLSRYNPYAGIPVAEIAIWSAPIPSLLTREQMWGA